MYEIEFDEKSIVLTLRFKGMWDVSDVMRYRDVLYPTLRKLRSRYPVLSILSDTRELGLLPKDVAEAFAICMGDEVMQPTGRCAVLVSKMLNKLQADRIVDNPLTQAFFDETEAREWIKGAAAA